MNKRRGKKGFTIVELVIVIVVIAVLAAVLIPLFANLVERARLSVDQQTVDGMNKVLIADEALSGKPKSLNAAKAVLESNNYRGNIAPTAKDHEFYWIPADNRVVLVKMNGDSPESIVYPKNLAEKYADGSPAEWYKLSESSDVETCLHESKRYVAIADGNTSTAHMEICSECNTVTINSEAHDTIGTNGACSKCGWKAPADGDSHVHAYNTVFLSDCNGHHYGVCSCGVLGSRENCTYDANGVCEKCHYAKPATGGDEHEHKFTYTPTSPYNGKHKKTCTVEGCSISDAEESCAYGLNKKCIYCGANMPGQGGGGGEEPSDPCADGHLVTVWTVIVEPTCTEGGYQVGNCTRCGELCIEELAAAHKVKYYKTGNPYRDKHIGVCSVCATMTTDSNGEACDTAGENGICSKCLSQSYNCTEFGHIWYKRENHNTKKPDCVCAFCGSWHYYNGTDCNTDGEGGCCSICGYKACEHTVTDWEVTKSPTCTETGARTGVCSKCGKKITETVLATGHNITSFTKVNVFQHEGVCNTCGESASESHKFELIGTGADENAIYHYKCACGTLMDISETDNPNHIHTTLNILDSEWGKTKTTLDGKEYSVWICRCPGSGCGATITYYVPVTLS